VTITPREKVLAAVDRALALDPKRDIDNAIQAAAAALGLPVEAVQAAMEPSDEELAALGA
jgi:hypothetical protein